MFNFNYGDYIFQQLIASDFIKAKLSYILISIVVNIIQIHLVSAVCFLLTFNKYVDFIVQIVVSVTCSLNVSYTYNVVERYTAEFNQISKYILVNLSLENYRYWKRIIVISAGFYACILLSFIQVTNQLLTVYIVQYLICFLIIEQFEQGHFRKWFYNYRTRPSLKKHENPEASLLIESYYSPRTRTPPTSKIIIPSGKITHKLR